MTLLDVLEEGRIRSFLLKEMRLNCDTTNDSQDYEISSMLAKALAQSTEIYKRNGNKS